MCTFVNRRADPVTLFDHYVDRFCTEMNFEWAVLFNNSDILNRDWQVFKIAGQIRLICKALPSGLDTVIDVFYSHVCLFSCCSVLLFYCSFNHGRTTVVHPCCNFVSFGQNGMFTRHVVDKLYLYYLWYFTQLHVHYQYEKRESKWEQINSNQTDNWMNISLLAVERSATFFTFVFYQG